MNPCINDTLYEYFGKTEKEYLPFLNILHNNSRGICDQIRSLLYYRHNLKLSTHSDREDVIRILSRMLNSFEIVFPPMLLDLLRDSEDNKHYPDDTHPRDHLLHAFYVFCLGCYVYDQSAYFRQFHRHNSDDYFRSWIVAAFFHDIGYCFTKSINHTYISKVERLIKCGSQSQADIDEAFKFWSHLMLSESENTNLTELKHLFSSSDNFNSKVRSIPTSLFEKKDCYFEVDIERNNILNEIIQGVDDLNLLESDDLMGFHKKSSHGLTSTLFLVFLLRLRELIINDCRVSETIAHITEKVSKINTYDNYFTSFNAIALHDVGLKTKKIHLSENSNPLIPLLAISDNFQCWDREYYYFELPDMPRAPIPTTSVDVKERDGFLLWKHDDTEDPENTKHAEYDSLIKDCTKLIWKEDVMSIIKDGNHE